MADREQTKKEQTKKVKGTGGTEHDQTIRTDGSDAGDMNPDDAACCDVSAKLKELKEKLGTERPVSWSQFPDIGLYKDQVVSYMYRQLINFEEGGQLTAAMVNNYIKDGLLPRAEGKKYSREHLAGLTEICLLKQVLSVKSTGFLLKQLHNDADYEKFYTRFLTILDEAMENTAGKLDVSWEPEILPEVALRMAITSYCDKLVCERLLGIIQSRISPEGQKKAEKKQDKNRG